MKAVLQLSFLLFFLLADMPAATAFCCTDSERQTCELVTEKENHQSAPCKDSSCHCICCGTVTMVCWNNFLTISVPQKSIRQQPKSKITCSDHLFTSSIWQPPK